MQGLGMGGLGGLQMQHMNPNAMGSMSAANGMSSSMASAGMSAGAYTVYYSVQYMQHCSHLNA
jgi:hypothetical protein